ncbi:MAG: hypothetical protein SNI51_05895 [Rikenellaceae bacterium]
MLKRSLKLVIMLLAPIMFLSCGVIRVEDPAARHTTVVYKKEQKVIRRQEKQHQKEQKKIEKQRQKEQKKEQKSSNKR